MIYRCNRSENQSEYKSKCFTMFLVYFFYLFKHLFLQLLDYALLYVDLSHKIHCNVKKKTAVNTFARCKFRNRNTKRDYWGMNSDTKMILTLINVDNILVQMLII